MRNQNWSTKRIEGLRQPSNSPADLYVLVKPERQIRPPVQLFQGKPKLYSHFRVEKLDVQLFQGKPKACTAILEWKFKFVKLYSHNKIGCTAISV